MRQLLLIITLLISPLSSFNSFAAVNIVECEDEEGNRSFQKTCPPNSTLVSEKRIATGKGTENSESSLSFINVNAILYTAPNCEACDEIKAYLTSRDISITEKDASENVEIQKELTELTGSLKVPTVVIGDKTITGYNRAELSSALKAAGYKEKES